FTSPEPSEDIVRLATEQAVDLVLVDGSSDPLGESLHDILRATPADVAVLVSREAFDSGRPVLVPFGAAQHDWAALELGSWLGPPSGGPPPPPPRAAGGFCGKEDTGRARREPAARRRLAARPAIRRSRRRAATHGPRRRRTSEGEQGCGRTRGRALRPVGFR